MHFWKSGFYVRIWKKQKKQEFGILSQLKKLSKSNNVHAQNRKFYTVHKELLLP
jgi:hypothetical protein